MGDPDGTVWAISDCNSAASNLASSACMFHNSFIVQGERNQKQAGILPATKSHTATHVH